MFDMYVNERLGATAIRTWLNENGHLNRLQRGVAVCAMDNIDADDADRSLIDALVDTYADTELVLDAARASIAARDHRMPVLEDELSGARQELSAAKESLERWYEAGSNTGP